MGVPRRGGNDGANKPNKGERKVVQGTVGKERREKSVGESAAARHRSLPCLMSPTWLLLVGWLVG
jgi:hypothetical protein